MEDVRAFVTAAATADGRETEGVGLGRELHLAGVGVTGFALRWKGTVVHLAAFPIATERRRWFTQ